MHRYKNRSGESGVVAYELGKDSITIQFAGGERYLYTARSAGQENIAKMRALTEDGRGLSTFISQHIREGYARKLN